MDQPTRGWKSDEDRGLIGAWFVRAIGDRSIEQVAKDMADRGHAHKPDYYRGIMSGSKKPGRLLLAALTEYLGSSPETAKLEPASDQSALIATLERFTGVITNALERVAPPKPVVQPATMIPSRDRKTRRIHWLELALTRRGWTVAQAAREIGRDATVVGRWINGTTAPRGAELRRLAEALDIPEALITNPPPTDAERLAGWHFGDDSVLREAM